MGPLLRYLRRKDSTVGVLDEDSSNCDTTSGDNSPCAVGKEGSVSLAASTELESFVRLRSLPNVTELGSMFWLVLVADVSRE